MTNYHFTLLFIFLSTLSLRRATQDFTFDEVQTDISIHALLAESDFRELLHPSCTAISIHALLAESDNIRGALPEIPCYISIHALLAESDTWQRGSRITYVEISIHALLAESDTPRVLRHCTTYLFLSTLSLRRATIKISFLFRLSKNFYPRSPCGERLTI